MVLVSKRDVGVAAGRRRRRAWSVEEKRRIVAETLEPGASVSIVARRHDLNANMLFTWRRTLGPAAAAAEEPGFVPAVIIPESPSEQPSRPATPSGRMEIVLAGGARVIVDETVDAAALARVITVLSRR